MKTKQLIKKDDYILIKDSPIPPLCKCGCNQQVTRNLGYSNRWNAYVSGHHKHIEYPLCVCGCNSRVTKKNKAYIDGHKKKNYPLCLCGCGEMVSYPSNKFIDGHYQKMVAIERKPIKHRKELALCFCGCGRRVIQMGSKYYKTCYSRIQKEERLKVIEESKINAPLCKCGCGEKVRYKKLYPLSYNEFIQGHNHKLEMNREHMRKICSNRHCPNIGSLEFIIFPKLIEVSPYKIHCLDSQRRIDCAHLDGWIEEISLVIEIDENHHNSEEKYILDMQRQERIKNELGVDVKFFRIKQKDWENKECGVIMRFIEVVNSLKINKEDTNL